jgi:hypothetical protein
LRTEKRGVLKRLQHLQPRNLPVFIIIALDSGDSELAEKILSRYSHKILSPSKQQVLNICHALVEFSKENYVKVKKMLSDEKPHDPALYIFCKTTLCKVFYELNDFRSIYPLTDSIRHFLRRRHEISELSPGISKFIGCVNKLSRIKKNNGKGIEDMLPVLKEEKLFFQKQWVVRKIEQLLNIEEH